LVDLLTGTEKVQVNADVPRGVKENVWSAVDNTGNIQRCEAGKKNIYWDERVSWITSEPNLAVYEYQEHSRQSTFHSFLAAHQHIIGY